MKTFYSVKRDKKGRLQFVWLAGCGELIKLGRLPPTRMVFESRADIHVMTCGACSR